MTFQELLKDECEENGVIDAYTKSMIVDMAKKVLEQFKVLLTLCIKMP